MNKNKNIASIIFALTAITSSSHAAVVLIDFGISDQTTTGNWNNATKAGGGVGAGNDPANIADLIDDGGTATGISMAYSEVDGTLSGIAGTGANYGGPYPGDVSGLPTSALQDSIYTQSGGSITLTFSGLDSSMTYSFLAYGGRGNNGQIGDYSVNGGTTQQMNPLNNSTGTVSFLEVAPVGGVITFTMSSTDAMDAAGTALNMIQITSQPVPEPSAFVLISIGGLAMGLRRRR